VFGSLFRPLEPVKSKRQRKNAEVPAADGTPLMARIKRERDENLRQSEAAENSANGTAQDDDFRSSTKSLTNVKLVGIKAKRSSLTESSDGLQEKRNLLDEEKGAAITKSASKRSIQASNKSLNKSDPRPMDRADAFFTGSVQRLPEYREDPANYHASVTRVSRFCMTFIGFRFKFDFFLAARFPTSKVMSRPAAAVCRTLLAVPCCP